MTIHRRPLARRALGLRPAAPDAAAAMPARSRLAPRHLRARPGTVARLAEDRGDVPGWVLITLMTAGIVVALWAVASDQIVQIFQNAMAPFLDGSM